MCKPVSFAEGLCNATNIHMYNMGLLLVNSIAGGQASYGKARTVGNRWLTPGIPRGISRDSAARGRPEVALSSGMGLLAQRLSLLRLHQSGQYQLCFTANILHHYHY